MPLILLTLKSISTLLVLSTNFRIGTYYISTPHTLACVIFALTDNSGYRFSLL